MKIAEYIRIAQQKFGANLANRVVMRHVGTVIAKNEQLPAHSDKDGDPLIQIIPKTQERYMCENGWETIEWTQYVEPAEEPQEAKKAKKPVLVDVPGFENMENPEPAKEEPVVKPRRRTSRK